MFRNHNTILPILSSSVRERTLLAIISLLVPSVSSLAVFCFRGRVWICTPVSAATCYFRLLNPITSLCRVPLSGQMILRAEHTFSGTAIKGRYQYQAENSYVAM